MTARGSGHTTIASRADLDSAQHSCTPVAHSSPCMTGRRKACLMGMTATHLSAKEVLRRLMCGLVQERQLAVLVFRSEFTGMLYVVCNYSVNRLQLACVWPELDSAHSVIQAGMSECMNE